MRARELDEAAIRRVLSMNDMKIKIEPFDILYIYCDIESYLTSKTIVVHVNNAA